MEYGEITEEFADFFQEKDPNVTGESVIIDFRELDAFNFEITGALRKHPESTIGAAEEVSKELLNVDNVEFQAFPEEDYIHIKNIRSKHIGTLIAVQGLVTSADRPTGVVVSAEFQCTNCGEIIEKAEPGV